MRVGILGPIELRGPNGEGISVPGGRTRALLAMLALDVGRIVSTSRLVEGVYGEEMPHNAASALQTQVSRLRQALRSAGLDDVVEYHTGGYRLALDQDDVDAYRFLRLAEEGRAALVAGDPELAFALLDEAERLWRGPATAELDAARLDAAEDRMQARLCTGQPAWLVAELRALVAAHPLRERLHDLLVRALHAAGRTSEALTAYESARRTLATELGIDPSPQLAATHLAILRDKAPGHTGLPAQLTSFVGRERELSQVRELLGQSRLVTLTGPGGSGKTRLAIEAASGTDRELCFVELAPLTDPRDVAQATLTALGLRETTMPVPGGAVGRASTVERIVTALDERRMLLVLDNCEHVIDAAAELAGAMLAGCSSLCVLATSREPLNITGESLIRVPRLTPEAAVRLFADRATAGQAEFRLDEQTLPQVHDICAALDGLPLPIELAAARVRQLPVAEVAARLADRFSLLSKGSRTAASRHRTLHAVVEWSWGLLNAAERELASRFTVFAGGATLDAISAVCPRPSAMDDLLALADKSFVERDGDRFRMLQTVHAFCAEQLRVSGEAEPARRAHAEYFLSVAETAATHLLRAEQLGWLSMLDAEQENLQAALRWATEADVELALRLASALVSYWWMRGRRSEGAQHCAALIGALGDAAPDGLAQEYAVCVLNAAFAAQPPANLAAALTAAERIVCTLSEPPRQPFLVVLHTIVAGPPTTDEQAANRFAVGMDADPWIAALRPLGAGRLAMFRGELSEADSQLRTSLHRLRALGERFGLTMVLGSLGQLETRRGNPVLTRDLVNEALTVAGELGAALEIADLHAQRAETYLLTGAPEAAAADYQRSAELAARCGSTERVATASMGLAELALRRGAVAEAKAIVERVTGPHCFARCELSDTRLRSRYLLSQIAAAEGDSTQERALLREVLTGAFDEGNLRYASAALDRLAWLALRDGNAVRATRLFGAARRWYRAELPQHAHLAAELYGALGEPRYTREQQHGQLLDAEAVRKLAAHGAG